MEEVEVFIVRLWRAPGPRESFRAAVTRAGTDESAWFTDAGAVARYFEVQAGGEGRSQSEPPGEAR